MISGQLARRANESSGRSQDSSQLAAQQAIARAEEDYRRLRSAYLELARTDRNEVALAMVGADMERAHDALQRVAGVDRRRQPVEPDADAAAEPSGPAWWQRRRP